MTARARHPPVATIIAVVAAAFNVRGPDILSHARLRRFVLPRHVAMSLTREMTGRSLPAVGLAFHRHHATVIAGIARVARRRQADAVFAAHYRALAAAIAVAPPDAEDPNGTV